ncbi:MAG: VOC family protein [Clostridia bacterium]|nr:VOC family protein [Clostridia bacterium]
MVKINGIHHVAIKANGEEQFEKTIAFYKDILGLPLIRRWEKGGALCAMLDTGAGILELFSNADSEPLLGPIRHIAFSVESVDDCIEAVRAAGYEITVEPKDVDIPSNPAYPIRVGFCIGAAGEEVEFFSER